MKREGEYLEIIRKLFHYEYNEEELRQLLKRFETEEEQKAFYKAVEQLWETAENTESPASYDPEKLLQRVLTTIRTKEAQPNKKTTIRSIPRKKVIPRLLKIAAIFILGLLLFFGGRSIYHWHQKEVCVFVKAPLGVKKSVILPDSSHVWLNSGSILKYPRHFGKTRKICLHGEAYFEVTKDAKHPFIVHTPKINVKVLGTGFNVSAYCDEPVQVTLVHGRVMAFRKSRFGRIKAKVILSPGEQTTFSEKTNTFQVRKINTSDYTAWIKGRLVFKNTPLPEVVKRINRWYNAKIVIKDNDSILNQMNYTVQFNKTPLPTVLKILHEMTPVCFKQSDGKIFVTKDKKRWKDFIKNNE
ncbi:FecR domain-containing protein [Candidatus Sulfidibacterium hydrothermale]|uniref:FecR family protein n=1 Tax=Candidatus Sulfidibacterium hydrothermale TaxID=2875962 RepID=UPI001F0A8AD8|nr:FecR family protein [Candidatus Sulfidibacterium hydrothermale]UBM62633.1 FecR domain-containing protein [Candidatus Sulfidibacterium hydrothermale]